MMMKPISTDHTGGSGKDIDLEKQCLVRMSVRLACFCGAVLIRSRCDVLAN
jgi:hypothetical protein